MATLRAATTIALSLLLALAARTSHACLVTVHIENDVGFGDTNYTQGARVDLESCFDGEDWWLANLRHDLDENLDYHLALGQNIYSPVETRFADVPEEQILGLMKGDRPYAALLYLAAGAAYTYPEEWRVSAELTLGVMGPGALGDQVQNGWHSLWGISNTRGWEHQVGTEPAFMLSAGADGAVMFLGVYPDDPRMHVFDLVTGVRARAGNIFTRIEPQLVARLGRVGPTFGKDRIPALAMLATSERPLAWELNAFLRLGALVSLRNFSVQGRLFGTDEVTEELRTAVSDADLGVFLRIGGFRAEVSFAARGPELADRAFDPLYHVFWQGQVGYDL